MAETPEKRRRWGAVGVRRGARANCRGGRGGVCERGARPVVVGGDATEVGRPSSGEGGGGLAPAA